MPAYDIFHLKFLLQVVEACMDQIKLNHNVDFDLEKNNGAGEIITLTTFVL